MFFPLYFEAQPLLLLSLLGSLLLLVLSQAVTKAKLGYDPLEVNPEDMVRYAKEKPQVRVNVIVLCFCSFIIQSVLIFVPFLIVNS